MVVPKQICSASRNHPVLHIRLVPDTVNMKYLVLWSCMKKSWSPRKENEQHDPRRKDINLRAFVRFPIQNFRSHVADGSALSLEVAEGVLALGWSSVPKISNFKVAVRIEK